jgi:hypothetical protein
MSTSRAARYNEFRRTGYGGQIAFFLAFTAAKAHAEKQISANAIGKVQCAADSLILPW